MLGALVLLACLALGWQTYRRPEIGLVAIGVAFALQCLYGNDQPGLLVAGINAYAGDLAALIVFQAALLRLAARPWRSWGLPMLAALALGLILFQSFGRGVLAFGLKQAGLGFRTAFIVYAFLLFGLAFLDLETFQQSIQKALTSVFLFLIAVILVRWFMVGTGLYINPNWGTSTEASTRIPIRVVSASEAFLLGQISLLWLAWRRYHAAAWGGLLVVLLLQHRSVWLAIMVSGGYLTYQRYREQRGVRISPRVVGVAFLAFLSVALALTRLPAIRAALESSATNEGTWQWRVASWAIALSPNRMAGWAWILGNPFGTPATRFMFGKVVDVQYHSHYVTTLVLEGFAGLALWIGLWSLAFQNAKGRAWAVALVLGQVTFGIAYSILDIQGLMLALATGLAGLPYFSRKSHAS